MLTALVRGYQLVVSPWFAPRCRYYPSCSAYALGSLRRHGPLTGTVLALWRVLRCNPWSGGGVDQVPSRDELPWRRRRNVSSEHVDVPTDTDGSPSDADRIALGADLRLDHRLSHQSPQERI
nr:membrane protein insertion efficiency factor YidD [Ruania zhangjianzhongii]